jgi:membrane protein insertase Oxa1/YidC/SpoIIIJ
MMPYSKVSSKAVKQTPGQADDIMQSMQKQNLYVMPVMFLIFGLKLPAGVMLYIFISTLFQIGQTYYFSGWGGLKSWIVKLKFGKKDM